MIVRSNHISWIHAQNWNFVSYTDICVAWLCAAKRFLKIVVPAIHPSAVYENFDYSIFLLFNTIFIILVGVVVTYHCQFNFYFLLSNDIEHSQMFMSELYLFFSWCSFYFILKFNFYCSLFILRQTITELHRQVLVFLTAWITVCAIMIKSMVFFPN